MVFTGSTDTLNIISIMISNFRYSENAKRSKESSVTVL